MAPRISGAQTPGVAMESEALPAEASALLRQHDILASAGRRFASLKGSLEALRPEFPNSEIGRKLGFLAGLLLSGQRPALVSLSMGGWDTHAAQSGQHRRCLGDLGAAVSRFRQVMVQAGLWDRVALVTHSEFGRRPAENDSGGTDHGTAAPLFVLGGGLVGGLYGSQPALDDLEAGDLRPTMDFRAVYRALAQNTWSSPWLSLPRAWPYAPDLQTIFRA